MKAQGAIPSFTNEVAGALAAFDYHSSNLLLGSGVGYAFNYIHYSESLGHGKLQEEMACLYGSYQWDHFWMNAVLWGGLYQFHNERHTLSLITSTAHTRGWIVSPHLEGAAPFAIKNNWCWIEPFLMLDWVNSWQRHFTERGSSGFNVVMDNHYASLLQTQLGLRFYEELQASWGKCLIEEKLSYVNQAPFHFHNVSTFFVGSASTFPIAVGSSKVQNLGGAQLCCSFLPRNQKLPYGVLDFEGFLGSGYQSYFVSVQIGKNF